MKIKIVGPAMALLLLVGGVGVSATSNSNDGIPGKLAELQTTVYNMVNEIKDLLPLKDDVKSVKDDLTTANSTIAKQQIEIDSLKKEISDLKSISSSMNQRLTELENAPESTTQFEERISNLEKANKMDEASIQKYISSELPPRLAEVMFSIMYYDVSSCPCTQPVEKEALVLTGYNIGSTNYDLLKYLTEDQLKEIATNAYKNTKTKHYLFADDQLVYQKILIPVFQPFGAPDIMFEVPL
jgi:DNA repair exonuclease SbcCD ATPase subunit